MTEPIPQARRLTVVLIDDHVATCRSMQAVIEATGAFEVVAVCHNLVLASTLVALLKPDVVVTDFRLSDGDASDAIPAWKSLPRPPIVVVVSNWTDARSRARAREAGADGYLPKREALSGLTELVREAACRRTTGNATCHA